MGGKNSWHRQMIFIYAIFIILAQRARECSKCLRFSNEAKRQKSPPTWSVCSRIGGDGLGGTVTKNFRLHFSPSCPSKASSEKTWKSSKVLLFPPPLSGLFCTTLCSFHMAALNYRLRTMSLVNWISEGLETEPANLLLFCFVSKMLSRWFQWSASLFSSLSPPSNHPAKFTEFVSFPTNMLTAFHGSAISSNSRVTVF